MFLKGICKDSTNKETQGVVDVNMCLSSDNGKLAVKIGGTYY
jgi:hypothetical protein